MTKNQTTAELTRTFIEQIRMIGEHMYEISLLNREVEVNEKELAELREENLILNLLNTLGRLEISRLEREVNYD